MNLIVCKQYWTGLGREGNEATKPMQSLVKRHFTGIISSQICEDLIGIMKNSQVMKATTRYRKPEVSMGKAIVANTISGSHKYKAVPISMTIPKSSKLSETAWRATDSMHSLDFKSVVTTSQAPPYPSQSATNACTRDADVNLIRSAHKRDDFGLMRKAWLGAIFKTEHQFIFQALDGKTRAKQWFVPGSHFPQSAVLVQKVDLYKLPRSDKVYIRVMQDDDLCWQSIFDLDMPAHSYKWESWQSTVDANPKAKSDAAPAVRMKAIWEVDTVKCIAAKAGFWNLSRALVEKYAEFLNINIPRGSSTFETVFYTVQGILKCNDEVALKACQHRVIFSKRMNFRSSDIVKIDAAIQTFDMHDHDEIIQTQKNAQEADLEISDFKVSFKAFRAAKGIR